MGSQARESFSSSLSLQRGLWSLYLVLFEHPSGQVGALADPGCPGSKNQLGNKQQLSGPISASKK